MPAQILGILQVSASIELSSERSSTPKHELATETSNGSLAFLKQYQQQQQPSFGKNPRTTADLHSMASASFYPSTFSADH